MGNFNKLPAYINKITNKWNSDKKFYLSIPSIWLID